jgi:PST family polysaccharide transporter
MPLWFFQGLEEMKYITYFNFVGKFLFTILIFVLIKNSQDFLIFIGLNSILSLGVSLSSLFFIFLKYKIKLMFPNKKEILHQINEGKHIFISNIGISLYTNSTTFILGLLTSYEIVGYFTAADKIRNAIQSIYSPISQAIYPRLASLFNTSKVEAMVFLKKVSSWVLLSGISMGFLILIFSREIIILILGYAYLSSISILKLMAFLPVIIAISNLGGIQVMLNIGEKKAFMKIILTAAILNLILLFVFIPYYNANGAAFSMLITEIYVTVVILISLNKKNINIFKSEYV